MHPRINDSITADPYSIMALSSQIAAELDSDPSNPTVEVAPSAGEDKDAGTEEVKERVLKEPVSDEERKSTTDAGAAEEKKDQEPGEEGREEDRK